jgi:ribosomal-protein-alanine N-acetyltransferase
MTRAEITISHITKNHATSGVFIEQLNGLAAQWQHDEEFWTTESCLESIKTQPHVISAFATLNNDKTWSGWYLATYEYDQAELLFVFTSKQQRGQGIARALLSDLIAQIKNDANILVLSLEVRPSNLYAKRLYETFGFELISIRKNYYKNGEDALVYQLKIRQ